MIRRAFPCLVLAITTHVLMGCQSDPAPVAEAIDVRALADTVLAGRAQRPLGYDTRPTPQQSPPSAPEKSSSARTSSDCDENVVRSLLDKNNSPIKIACSVTLPAGAVVTRQVVFEGDAASGSILDCNGGRLEGVGPKSDRGSVLVKSEQQGDKWSRPNGVTVKNCEITGGVRIFGLGRNGEAEGVKKSSVNRNHTSFAQSVAPTNVTFDQVRIKSSGGVPFYVSPGATRVTLTNSLIEGKSSSAVIYLDAESSGNRILNNTFNVATKNREVIAVDGSAYNEIAGNRFETALNGGVFLYRNCGEGGTIRHQAPQHNRIEGNFFDMSESKGPAIWLNSRNGNRSYCFQDPARPFGSSLTSQDLARDNTVENNRISGTQEEGIRNDDPSNRVSNNRQ